MAYQTVRRDGRNITIDTATGKEVGIGQGALKDFVDKLGLSTLHETLPLTLKQTSADIQNLYGDISRHLIYSDQVDKKGRPLTIAQANPQERQLIPEMRAYLARNGKSDQDKPKFADLRGSIIPTSLQPAASNLGEGAAMDAAERSRAGAGFPAGVTRPSDYPISSPTKKITSEDSELPSTTSYNAKERVKKYGVKKAEDMAMMEWAKAHKGLAEKVKPGQAGYDAIQLALGKTTVEPDEIRAFEEDHGRTKEEARAILGGGSVETVIDGNKPMVTTINQAPTPDNQKGAEAFKNFAIGALQGLDIGKYKDLGVNPFTINPEIFSEKSVDFNVPGLEGTLGNYGTADYGELLKKYPNVFSYK